MRCDAKFPLKGCMLAYHRNDLVKTTQKYTTLYMYNSDAFYVAYRISLITPRPCLVRALE